MTPEQIDEIIDESDSEEALKDAALFCVMYWGDEALLKVEKKMKRLMEDKNEPLFRLWCPERSQWWRQSMYGYTSINSDAGVFTKADANRVVGDDEIIPA